MTNNNVIQHMSSILLLKPTNYIIITCMILTSHCVIVQFVFLMLFWKCKIYILLIYYDAIYLNKCLLTCKGGFPSFFCLTCIFYHLNHSLMHQCNLKHFNKIDLCEPQNIGRQTDVQQLMSILGPLVNHQFWTSVRRLNLVHDFDVQP